MASDRCSGSAAAHRRAICHHSSPTNGVLGFRSPCGSLGFRMASAHRFPSAHSGERNAHHDAAHPRLERNPAMKWTLVALLLIAPLPLAAQQPPSPDNDPIGRYLIPPELVMSHSEQIGLT